MLSPEPLQHRALPGTKRCHSCSGPFGLIRHRFALKQFCSKQCLDQYKGNIESLGLSFQTVDSRAAHPLARVETSHHKTLKVVGRRGSGRARHHRRGSQGAVLVAAGRARLAGKVLHDFPHQRKNCWTSCVARAPDIQGLERAARQRYSSPLSACGKVGRPGV